MTMTDIVEKIAHNENLELYLIVFLTLFTVWFVVNTIKYYRGEKRKVKHLHRFAREGETLSQYELAKRYAKGQAVRKSCQNAASLSQKAVFGGEERARELLDKILEKENIK